MAEIKADVREMQAKGNYGDGTSRQTVTKFPAHLQVSGPMVNDSEIESRWGEKACVWLCHYT